MGFHSDDPSALQPGTGVAIVSLGNSRNITYRNQKNPSLQHILTLSSGSVLYMKSTVQDEWLDAINRHVGASNVLALHGVPFAPTNLIKLNLKSLPYKVKNIK